MRPAIKSGDHALDRNQRAIYQTGSNTKGTGLATGCAMEPGAPFDDDVSTVRGTTTKIEALTSFLAQWQTARGGPLSWATTVDHLSHLHDYSGAVRVSRVQAFFPPQQSLPAGDPVDETHEWRPASSPATL